MKKAELIFIPAPGAGHLFSTIELAKILLNRDDRLSITLFIINLPVSNNPTPSLDNNNPRLKLVDLPNDETVLELRRKSPDTFFFKLIEYQATRVRENVAAMISSSDPDSPEIAGFVVDMLCTDMIDVADEFSLPSYLFFTTNASMLGLMFHVQKQTDEQNEDFSKYKNSNAELSIPGFKNPVPPSVIPLGAIGGGAFSAMFLKIIRGFRRTKGIIINTFMELEPYALEALNQGKNPPVYTVGPVVDLKNNDNNNNNNDKHEDIMKWLDYQPPSSVVFLCFGSMGSFEEKQVKEIAIALENSGHRFLWSLRKRPTTGQMRLSSDETNPEKVLPEGFLERTKEIGKIIGWAPQVAVLSHPAVGGFVSHCGWNSTLESVWCGVPMATWPLYAEQQLNAFLLVKELEMAAEIKMDFRADMKGDITDFVSAAKIESGIRQLMMMNGDNGVREKVKDAKEKSVAAIVEGGSSYNAIGRLVEDFIGYIA